MKSSSYWYGKNRFDSFAPIRLNVAVQWLVDGVSDSPSIAFGVNALGQRDYFWNLSRAIQLAKHAIYIHGWWLTPGQWNLRSVCLSLMVPSTRALPPPPWKGELPTGQTLEAQGTRRRQDLCDSLVGFFT